MQSLWLFHGQILSLSARKTNTPYQPITFSCVTADSCTYTSVELGVPLLFQHTSEHMFTPTHTIFKICIYHKIWRLLLLLLFFVCLFFWDRVSLCSLGCPGTQCIQLSGFTELTELHLSLPPECYDQRCVPPCLTRGIF